ncbi:phosphoglycolate phosphatase [Rhodospirillales bacterium TMPK1]|uniref:Phosphoglycolate phosphatase n=1 Tax=Roseiterribacter gracilis TaxID=2812848 RepID=A0A8S8XAS8_9PROT|nr:phosphoglycolate phosphatase [Rhodospirillales bacterium TMPK1]
MFDFDGTLADSMPWFLSVFDDIADEFSFRRVTAAEREELRGLGSREIVRRLGVSMWKMPRIARRMRARKLAQAHAIPLFADTARLLGTLTARGVRIAVVSSDSEASMRCTLGPLADRIEFFEGGVGMFGKAARLRKALRRARVAPHEATYVGDEARDADAAQKAGLRFVAVGWGYATPAAFAPSIPLATTADELLRLLAPA